MPISQKTICVVSQQIKNIHSGPGLHTNLLIDALTRVGYKIVVLSHERERGNHYSYAFKGKTISPNLRNHASWMTFSLGIRKPIKIIEEEYQPNIIHFTDFRDGLFCDCNTQVFSQLNDTYTVDIQPSKYYKKFYKDWISRWVYYNFAHFLEKQRVKNIDAPIANSHYTKKIFEANYPNMADITVIHKGIDVNFYKNIEQRVKPDDSPKILFVGGNMQRKGLLVLLKAMPYVLTQIADCALWVVGNDPLIPHYIKTAKKLGIEEQVVFLGQKNQNDLLNLYRDANLFVLPALIEAFGVVILEAMASGIPVIASNCGGIPEIILDGENGTLVPPGDDRTLAEKIVNIIKDEKQRNAFRQNGFETSQRFSAEKMIKATIDLYEKLAN